MAAPINRYYDTDIRLPAWCVNDTRWWPDPRWFPDRSRRPNHPCGDPPHPIRPIMPTPRCRKSRGGKYWVRPVDGKRRGARGRLLDGLTGEGPDVFVVTGGRQSWQMDRPDRWEWSNWCNPELHFVTGAGCGCVDCGLYWKELGRYEMGWAKRQKKYTPHTRRYEYLH